MTRREIADTDVLYHIGLAPKDVGRYVLIPGDPGRVDVITEHLENPVQMAFHREYKSINGTLDGATVTVISSGIGGPSTAIALEELVMCGADTFIRVGTCGGMQRHVTPGSVVVATAAIRAEGTSREYLPLDFPAVADFDVTCALRDAAKELGYNPMLGVVQCKDSFYGQHDPERMPIHTELALRWQAWKAGGCLASEMESAAMFIIASTLGVRAGTVLHVAGNQDLYDTPGYAGEKDPIRAILAAIEATRKLIRLDREKEQQRA